MNRFLERKRGGRIAAVVSHEYPATEQAHVYERLDALSEYLDAELTIFHSIIPDPRDVGAQLKPRVGMGFFVRRIELIHAADIDHFARKVPLRYQQLVAELTRLFGVPEREVLARYDVQAAFTFARWMQAWAPDLIYGFYLSDHAFFALVASFLLGVPSVFHFTELDESNPNTGLLDLFCATANAIVAGSDAQAERLFDRIGHDHRCRILRERDARTPEFLAALKRLMVSSKINGSPALGPQAAFVTVPSRSVRMPSQGKSFVVVGAERTGSNMLVDTLTAQREISCAGEVFNPRVIQDGFVPWLDGVDFDHEAMIALRAHDPGGLHATLVSSGERTGAQWVGFKLLYFHGVIDNRIMDHLAGVEGLKVIHLLRADRLRRWLSHYKAQVLDSWYTEAGSAKKSRTGPLELGVVETLTDFAYVELLEERYRATFRHADWIEIDYDEFVSDLPGTSKRLSAFFGMQLGELVPKSRKTGVVSLEHGISNLETLRESLSGTRWASLLDPSPGP